MTGFLGCLHHQTDCGTLSKVTCCCAAHCLALWPGAKALLSALAGQGCSDSGSQIRWQQMMASFLPALTLSFSEGKCSSKLKRIELFLKLIFVGVDLLYSVALVSDLCSTVSQLYTYTYPLFGFPSIQSSMCYTMAHISYLFYT